MATLAPDQAFKELLAQQINGERARADLDAVLLQLRSLVIEKPELKETAVAKLAELVNDIENGVNDSLTGQAKKRKLSASPTPAPALKYDVQKGWKSTAGDPFDKLTKGFLAFKSNELLKKPALFEPLKTGQSPKVLVIACCDSRVAPETIFGASPGELFVVRNIANLVPSMGESETLQCGTSAALEYAVLHLGVEHIVVEGHRGCGGIKALMTAKEGAQDDHHTGHKSYIPDWMNIAARAKEHTLKGKPKNPEEALRSCERNGVIYSIRNLLTFPWIKERLDTGRLLIHGFVYDFVDGTLKTKTEGAMDPMWQTFE